MGKRDKMQGLLSILSLFCNRFYKFNSTGAQILDSIDHMTMKLLFNHILRENTKISPCICLDIADVIT